MATGTSENPFLKQGVASFGNRLKTCDGLRYMEPILEAVENYLRAENRTNEDQSNPIAITGGHGSGKTHLMMWLSDKVESISSANASSLYGKVNSDSFVDLYRELWKKLTRTELLRLITEAVKQLAESKVGRAEISESLAKPIREAPSLDSFVKAGYLDKEELYQALRKQLIHLDQQSQDAIHIEAENQKGTDNEKRPSGFSETISKMIMMVDDPKLGDAAFAWLRGDSVSGYAELGVSTSLFEPVSTNHQSSADAAAIDAFESIAALFRLADRPLVVMIDQVEMFIRSNNNDTRRLETIYSLLKKLIERLKRQGALIILAGAPDAWENIRRDVWPRLSQRKPFEIGNLTLDETGLLLKTYHPNANQIDPEMLKVVHVLSGGSPREIIRIAYQAYGAIEGDWLKLTENILKKSAKKAGSIREQLLYALELTDKVLVGYDNSPKTGKGILKNLEVDEGVHIHRLIHIPNGPTLAFTFLCSTDPLIEIGEAEQIVQIRERLHVDFPNVLLFVIAIGYSSYEVKKMLGETAIVLKFLESTYESKLNLELAKHIKASSTLKRIQENSELTEAIEALREQVRQLSEERVKTAEKSEIEFTERIQEQTQIETSIKEGKTRWEIEHGLDELQGRLLEFDLMGERRLMRSLLVANELNIKDSGFDYGGSIYLDVVERELLIALREKDKMSYFFRDEFMKLRSDIITELRRVVRPKTQLQTLLHKPTRASLFGFLASVLFVSFFTAIQWVIGGSFFYTDGFLRPDSKLLLFISILFIIISPSMLFLIASNKSRIRFKKFEVRLHRLRNRNDSTTST